MLSLKSVLGQALGRRLQLQALETQLPCLCSPGFPRLPTSQECVVQAAIQGRAAGLASCIAQLKQSLLAFAEQHLKPSSNGRSCSRTAESTPLKVLKDCKDVP